MCVRACVSFHFLAQDMDEAKGCCKDKREFIAFILPMAIQEIVKANLPPPSDKNFRDLISNGGGDSKYKSSFLNQPTRVRTVRVFR